jgi:hypothetical protein
MHMKRTLLSLVMIISCGHAYAGDISISAPVLTYRDDVTTPGKVVERELLSIQDGTYWSKPDTVNVSVEVRNKGDSIVRFIRVSAEHYYLLKADASRFPPMKGELRTITDEPVWVWTNTPGSKAIRELRPGEKKVVIFKDLPVRSRYYATGYQFQAFAVRVFASPRDGDDDYSNNVSQKIISYGD